MVSPVNLGGSRRLGLERLKKSASKQNWTVLTNGRVKKQEKEQEEVTP